MLDKNPYITDSELIDFISSSKKGKFFKLKRKPIPENDLARELITARIKKNLTQDQLAKLAKSDQATISRLEKGKMAPSFSLLKRIASALDKKLVIRFERL